LAHRLKGKLKSFYGEFSIYLIAGLSIAVTFGILFFKLATEVLEREMEWFDTGIISIMTQSNFSFIDFISGTLNFLDNPIVFVILILLYLLYIKTFYRKNMYGGMAIVTFIGSFLLQWSFKSLYKRPRLSSIDVDIFAYSFPSGFIVIFTALLGYVAFLLLKNKSKLKKIVIISAWLCLIIVVSASRIRAAISYPSDVLAGFLLGGLWLAVCIVGTKALEYYGIDS